MDITALTSTEDPVSSGASSDMATDQTAERSSDTITFPAFNPTLSSPSSLRTGAGARVEKQRNRRGSLRRSAILSGGEGRMRELERRGLGEKALVEMGLLPGRSSSPEKENNAMGEQAAQNTYEDAATADLGDAPTKRSVSLINTEEMDPSAMAALSLRLDTTSADLSQQISPSSNLTSPITSPNYASTTDDEEGLHMSVHRSISAALSHPNPAAAMADLHRRLNVDNSSNDTQSNYLTSPLTPTTTVSSLASTTALSPSLAQTISTSINTALLTTHPEALSPSTTTSNSSALTPSSSAAAPPPAPLTTPSYEHDYAATARWGYIILLSTWIVFVVGMGSCFDLWSWAWDVGQTPYAPPELEDDDSLPIVGYYPALMALAGVMAWIWVTVAWVGMKSFRHAKVSGEVEE